MLVMPPVVRNSPLLSSNMLSPVKTGAKPSAAIVGSTVPFVLYRTIEPVVGADDRHPQRIAVQPAAANVQVTLRFSHPPGWMQDLRQVGCLKQGGSGSNGYSARRSARAIRVLGRLIRLALHWPCTPPNISHFPLVTISNLPARSERRAFWATGTGIWGAGAHQDAPRPARLFNSEPRVRLVRPGARRNPSTNFSRS